jgi:hypothetical protein
LVLRVRFEKNKIKVRAFDGPMSSVILGRTGNGRGWAQVEVYLPRVDARHRPSFFFKENEYPVAFANLEKMFDRVWDISKPPSGLGQVYHLPSVPDPATTLPSETRSPALESESKLPNGLGGHPKTGHVWPPQNRPYETTSGQSVLTLSVSSNATNVLMVD